MALLTPRFVRSFVSALSSAAACFGLTGLTHAQTGPVFPGARYASGGVPDAVASGDVNGDGIRDLVVANGNDTVTVLLGVGDGTFGAGTSHPSGGAGASLALAHWNGDGILDIALAHGGFTNEISLLLSTGPGTYAAPVKFISGSGSVAVVAGDWNGDGDTDLAIAGSSSNNVTVYTGDGAGLLTLAGTFAAGAQPRGLVAIDTNADSKLDLVVSNFTGSITVLLGNGAASFSAGGGAGAGGLSDAIAAGDLDNNGTADVAVSNYLGAVNATVLLGSGTGTFTATTGIVGGLIFPTSIAIAELTGDSNRDVVLTAAVPPELSVFPGNGAGGVGALTRKTAGSSPLGIAIGDFNGDTRNDAAVSCGGPSAVCVLLGKPGGLESAANADVNTDPRGLASADVNNDGKRDLLTANFGTNDFSLVLGDGTGALGVAANFAAGAGASAIATGDLNGNGNQDAVVANATANNVSIHLGNGIGGFAAPSTLTTGTQPVALTLADWNNDSILDLVAVNRTSNNLTVRLGNGAGSFGGATTIAVGTSPLAVAVADVNGNGVKDLAVANSVSNNVSVLLGNGSGGFGAAASFAAGTAPSGVASADFIGNGSADLAVSNLTSANVSILLGNGSGGFAAATSYLTGSAPNSIVALDLDADTKADVAVGLETPFAAALLSGSGTGTLGAPKNFAVAGGVKALLAADFNGDARPDLGSANSNTADVSVLRNQLLPPAIVTPPSNLTVCEGSPANFTVVANNAITYQWRKNTIPLSNGGGISGATTASLSIAAASPSSAGAYDCQVTNIFGTATSAAAVLTVNGLPVISVQPQAQTVCAATPVVFTVTATPATGYQWRKNSVNIGGATSSAYTINSPVAGDTGNYDCIVSNACGSTPSSIAALVVVAGNPLITLNPVSQSVCAGTPVSLTMSATGAVSFQWRKNNVNIGGATTTTLNLNPVVLGDAASYDCVATNVCGSSTTTAAVLTVFSGNPSIGIPPLTQSACVGGAILFSVTASNAATYQWRKNGVNIGGATGTTLSFNPVNAGDAANYDVVVSNSCGSVTSSTAILTVYTGNPLVNLPPLPASACAGSPANFSVVATGAQTLQWRKDGVNIGGATSSTLVINPVVAGSAGNYDVVLTNSCGTTTSPSAVLTVYTGNPVITVPPLPQAACAGLSANFSVTATGAATYQWRKNGVNIGGATSSALVLNPVVVGDAGNYDCVVGNTCGSSTSASASLTVSSGNPVVLIPPVPSSVCVAGTANFSVNATGALTYQWRKNGVNIGGATASAYSIVGVTLGDAGNYDCVVGNGCGSTTSAAAALTVNSAIPSITIGPEGQSACAGSSAAFSVTATGALTYQWRKDGVNIGGATTAVLIVNPVNVSSAGSYDVVVGNGCGNSTSAPAVLVVSNGLPSITLDPVNAAECDGGTASFVVGALGALTYQWRKDGIDIGGATAPLLSIGPVSPASAGSYDCRVTNACGSVTSSAASLVVSNGIPVLTSHPASTIACTGDAVAFSVTATGAAQYQWRKDAIDIGGATASTFPIASAMPADAGAYDCVVTNPCGSVTSNAANLTISDILYVNSAAAGANTGKTWTDAFTDLQSALGSPRATVQIWVAAGTYRPDQGTGNRSATFQLVNGKAVYGGFDGTETQLSDRDPRGNVTTLSGEIGAAGSVDNSFHVVTGSGVNSNAILDGFTIRDGNADAGSGGGVLTLGGTPSVVRCILLGNRAANGAGAAVDLAASTSFVNCSFLGNVATGNGGGLHLGPGVAGSVVNGLFCGNTAASGGALYNTSGALGLTSSTLTRNGATGTGGGVRTLGALTFVNTILWNNSDASGTTESAQVNSSGGSASGTYSVVQGLAALAGTGNLGSNPDLVDADGPDNVAGNLDDDLRVTPYSPCIDAGNSGAIPADTADLDGDGNLTEPTPLDPFGNPRQLDDPWVVNTGVGPAPIVDIGGYELCTCDPLPFGTGTPGCNGPMVVGTSEPPKINTPTFQLTCTNAPPSSLGLGLVSNAADPIGSDLFGIGVLLHTDLIFSTEVLTFDFFSDPLGNGFVAAPIPNLPILIGQVYYAQGLWFWGTCVLPPNNLSTTRGLKITILP